MLGMQAFNTLPITRFPNIDVPVVAVTVTQSGASPSELEMQVTKEIEDAVASEIIDRRHGMVASVHVSVADGKPKIETA